MAGNQKKLRRAATTHEWAINTAFKFKPKELSTEHFIDSQLYQNYISIFKFGVRYAMYLGYSDCSANILRYVEKHGYNDVAEWIKNVHIKRTSDIDNKGSGNN